MSRPTADLTKYGYVKYRNRPLEWFRRADGYVPEHDLRLTFITDGRSPRPLMLLSIDGIPMCVTRYDQDRFETTWMGYMHGAYDLWETKNAWLWYVMGEWGKETLAAYEAIEDKEHIKEWINTGSVPDPDYGPLWPSDVLPTSEEKAKLKEVLGDFYPSFPMDDGHELCEFQGTLASILYESAPDRFPEEPTGW